ncbi:ABC transporter ATP-binding protein [Ornatilinea apprima]|uniref:ABC transporter ATP-binding protein n=1 Tax=Ornatilinea apprima TaxID=1134406 RepID=UPI000A9A3A44|nr:ABC transporter ATP-binding protein [Ornatilinea apprima]
MLALQEETTQVENQTQSPVLVKLREVVKTYHTPAGDFPALRGLSADFERGHLIGVIGKSGAGKSTLVNMLTGVDHLSSGEIWVDGVGVHALNENELALWRGRNVGVIYQSFQLLPNLTLLDNVMMPMDLCGLYHPQRSPQRAMELLDLVEMADQAFKIPSTISGGQQQRAAIARALANDPQLIVADEPTGSLDSATAETIFLLFERLVAQGKTIVMVTHDHSLARRMTRIYHIADGLWIDDEKDY